ncbi:hypothetical protein Taro_018399 [Colocasia esculenta]|uniref:Uncharacterized protein n=1 Tax=Colocasia esculenta TaxID=4460 RepID=A0A843UW22_COLES|nr:hypothetical protein [Colocasia esculenta]
MAANYRLAAINLDVDKIWRPHRWMPAWGWRPDPWTSIGFTRNIVNVTVELSSFGRPKKEKLEPHLRSLREATAPTQPSQSGSQPSQPTIHRRQRETSDVREHPEDIHRRQRGHGREAKRIVYKCVVLDLCSCFSSGVVVRLSGGWHVGTRTRLCLCVVGVLPTPHWFSVVRGVGKSASRWQSLLSICLVTVRPIGMLVLDHVVCRRYKVPSFGLTSDVFRVFVTVCHVVERVTPSFCGSACVGVLVGPRGRSG